MLNEPASSLDDDHPQSRGTKTLAAPEETADQHPHYDEIRDAVETVLTVANEEFPLAEDARPRRRDFVMLSPHSQLLMTFRGRLRMDSEVAYRQLDNLFISYDLLPVFRQEKNHHVVHVIQGRVKPASGGVLMSVLLFIATVLSVLLVGTQFAIAEIAYNNPLLGQLLFNDLPNQLWRGWPYAVSIMAILGAHELGHYFMTRKHRTAASLPYFLPFPFGIFGTFGAAIRLREPMRNRKVLLDVGASGPLAGLAFAVPILFIGLATSQVNPIGSNGFQEGNSIFYALAKIIVFGRFLPDGSVDVYVNQLAWAGWTGLLVTGLNLIPVGQLDGGHIMYSLFGKRARLAFYPLIGALLLLTIFLANQLLIFVLLILLLGNYHAVPLDDITPLDKRRRSVAILTLLVFFLVFVPIPLSPISAGRAPMDPGSNLSITVAVALIALWLAHRRR
jgi:membrane-associated protease RseP (regulator of RpoE activity)